MGDQGRGQKEWGPNPEKRRGPEGSACRPPTAQGRKQPHLRVSTKQNTTKIQREDPQRERKRHEKTPGEKKRHEKTPDRGKRTREDPQREKNENGSGRRKKSPKFWAVWRRVVRRRGGPGKRDTEGPGHGGEGVRWPKSAWPTKIGLATKIGFDVAKIDQAKAGGQSWPKSVWPDPNRPKLAKLQVVAVAKVGRSQRWSWPK